MTLTERIAQSERCRVTTCPAEHVEGALYCGSAGRRHLTDNWAGRIRELSDGTVIVTAGPQNRQPAWLRRMGEVGLPAKDMTGSPV